MKTTDNQNNGSQIATLRECIYEVLKENAVSSKQSA